MSIPHTSGHSKVNYKGICFILYYINYLFIYDIYNLKSRTAKKCSKNCATFTIII